MRPPSVSRAKFVRIKPHSPKPGNGMARRGRQPCCEKVGLNKGSWTPEEDLRLIAYINKHGHGNWRALPKLAGLLRCGKSCRLRWINYLRPDIKRGNFSGEEEEAIIRLHELLGNKWSKIAACLPGRTDNEIKNVWNTHLKKRLKPASPAADEKAEDSQASSSPSSSADGSSLDLIDLPMEMIDMDIWTPPPPPPPSQQVSPSSSSSELSRIVGEDRREQPLLVSTTSAERFLLEDEAELGEGINDSAWLEYLEKELGLCAATESNQVGEANNGDGRMEAWDFEVAEEEEDPVSCYFQRELNFTSSPLRLT